MITNKNRTANVTLIVGPTASGKSAYALDYAQKHNGVIINADSQQLYKSLPILSAQPSEKDQSIIPHKLYGFLDDSDFITAIKWAEIATQEIKSAWADNKHPILVGGTGFYIKALLDGFSPIPDVPLTVRDEWNAAWDELGSDNFYNHLITDDPLIIGKINPNDKQRLVRAREVLSHTGISIIEWQTKAPIQNFPEAQYDVHIIMPTREKLYKRCNERILTMLNDGALDEIRNLYNIIGDTFPPSTKALGYSEFLNHIKDELSLNDAIEQTAQITRNYAKRQTTWFRHQMTPKDNISNLWMVE